jgi:hypothetical protein
VSQLGFWEHALSTQIQCCHYDALFLVSVAPWKFGNTELLVVAVRYSVIGAGGRQQKVVTARGSFDVHLSN